MKQLLASVIIAVTICSTTHAQSSAGVQTIVADTVLVNTATMVVREANRIAKVWPGFWPRPFGIYRRNAYIIVYSPDSKPLGYEPIPDDLLPPELRGKAYGFVGSWLPLQGGVFPIIPTMPPGSPATGSVEIPPELNQKYVPVGVPYVPLPSAVSFLLHEIFHSWQREGFAPNYYAPASSLARPMTPTELAQIDKEKATLVSAITALAEGKRDLQAVRAYLDARAARHAQLDTAAIRFERAQENNEGTATYVGTVGELIARTHSLAELPTQLIGVMHILWPVFAETAQRHVSQRAYVTGAALAYMLETLGVADWRASVASGIPLEILLRQRIK